MKQLSRDIQLPQSYTLNLLPYFESPYVYISSDFSPSESVGYLRNECNVKKAFVHSMIRRHPGLSAGLLMRIHASNPPIMTIRDVLRQYLTDAQVQQVEESNSSVLRTVSRTQLRSKLSFLSNHECPLSQDSKIMSMLLTKHPEFFAYPIKNIRGALSFVEESLQMSADETQRLVTKMPVFLSYSINNDLAPSIRFFEDELGFSPSQIRRMIITYPPVANYSGHANIEAVLDLMNEIFDDPKDILRISLVEPIVWSLPIDDLVSRVSFLSQSMELDLDELRIILTSLPKLLTLSVDNNVMPKMDFFLKHMSKEDLRAYVLESPTILSSSLDSRIRPRIEQISQLGFDISVTPAYLMMSNNKQFEAWRNQFTAVSGIE